MRARRWNSVRDVTMNEINGLLVLPLTAMAQQAFTGFIGGIDLLQTHSWGGVSNFVKSARAHF